MANQNDKFPENIAGQYYVDSSCIDCDMCRSTAPDLFRRDDEIGYSIVYRQPITDEEFRQAEDARLGCPTESIGNDGLAVKEKEMSSLGGD
jgi:ferredoxin